MVGKIWPEPGDNKSLRVLNRIVTWTEKGLELEGDQRHVEIIGEMLGLTGANGVTTPGVRANDDGGESVDGELALRMPPDIGQSRLG